jgi:RNA polymerase sigma factor (sigma-70 family)
VVFPDKPEAAPAAEAEEATQDAFLAALKAFDSYRGEAALSTWLYRITINLCRTRLRRRNARERLKKTLRAIFRVTRIRTAVCVCRWSFPSSYTP